GPHPVRTPAGDDDRFFTLDGAIQGGGHGGVGAVEQVDIEAVDVERAVAGGHKARAGIDADYLAAEHVGVLVDLGDAIDLDVSGYGPADVGTFEVGAEVVQLVAVLVPVRFVSRG